MTRFFVILLMFFGATSAFADQPVPWQLDFQEAASPVMAEIHQFHNFLLILSAAIVLFVIFLIAYVLIRFNAKSNPIPSKFTHNTAIEVIWTVIPIIILVIIAIPSFRILKMAEHTPQADMTIKVVGSQWYWTYSYPDHENIEFDSYMIQTDDLKPGQLRLLEVDNRIVVPEGATIKFLITAADVIHSFAVPALGIKTDAVPGRTNEAWTRIDKKGVYYGQCSELCGVNHGFMPIAIEVVSKKDFETWLAGAKKKFASQSINFAYHNTTNK
ncbi:MAG: cytochrome c oxidase subunit II [Rickettsiaceae bacterium]|nr:cytochrome c oxidase subunit II [Rickettsiaceae bacterium]